MTTYPTTPRRTGDRCASVWDGHQCQLYEGHEDEHAHQAWRWSVSDPTPPPVPPAERFTLASITVDHTLRIEALNAATHWLIGQDQDDLPRILDTARAFEAYLRGDQ